ncbi:hypothetical protein K432DRAFT_429264 [Lepidopterella palustris CBS 459.81]|uniref:Structure-specific endonuclease subunit SLX4 n=1 Tax=Lepidopterella palustris CBS 459.81 TaxID=1314670 RepID=A0A8E2E1S2_9PEZI|nr:hypothetical protein K432DRAFT_429264 [Lepidopterella palustris CBS 459.81]
MASRELVILSSPPRSTPPPPGNQPHRVIMSSSSPSLPSPSLFFSKKLSGALKSGSRAAQVPEEAIVGFATAASLVKSQRLSLAVEEYPPEQQPRRQRRSLAEVDANTTAPPKEANKRSTKASNTKDGEPVSKQLSKSKNKADTDIANEDLADLPKPNPPPSGSDSNAALVFVDVLAQQIKSPAAAKSKPTKPRKSRVPTEKSETQIKLKKGKITKPRAGSTPSKDIDFGPEQHPQSKTTGVACSHVGPKSPVISHPKESGSVGVVKEPLVPVHVLEQRKDVLFTGANKDLAEKIVSKHFHQGDIAGEASDEQQLVDISTEGLSVESAVRRRTEWTPPKNTEATVVDELDDMEEENHDGSLQPEKLSFTNLLATYTYSSTIDTNPTVTHSRQDSGEALTKRRRIEPLSVPSNPNADDAVSLKKVKAPRQKPTTITDRVTAQYKPSESENPVPAVVSNVFAHRVADGPSNEKLSTSIPTNANNTTLMKPPRKRAPREKSPSKADGKAKKSSNASTKTKAKPKLAAAKLLSPESAVRRMNKQEILFGTSSQLARDESPTFVRQIQQAIRESEAEASLLHPGNLAATGNGSNFSLQSTKLSLMKASRGLWSAAARDSENGLLEVEELIYHPRPASLPPLAHEADEEPRQEQKPEVVVDEAHQSQRPSIAQYSSGFVDIEELEDPPPQPVVKSTANELDFVNINELASDPEQRPNERSAFLDIDDFQQGALSVPPPEGSAAGNLGSKPPSKLNSTTTKDKYSRPTEGSMTATIKSSSRKQSAFTKKVPVKKPRVFPPQSALVSFAPLSPKTPKAAKSTASQSKTLKPMPKKTTSKLDFTHIDEISDSEAESNLTPSPPRISLSPNGSPPLELRPSQSDTTAVPANTSKASDLSWEIARVTLFPEITEVVKGALPTTDPSKPSWHEKMLMYDPIVLEDFTAWLNEQGLYVLGKAPVVKGKRKGKWKKRVGMEGVGGGEEAGGEVQVVRKNLEVWMVQDWCQEKSVCCLSREEKGWSGKGRY